MKNSDWKHSRSVSNYMEKIEWLFTCLGGFWRWVGFVLFCFIVGVGFFFCFCFWQQGYQTGKGSLSWRSLFLFPCVRYSCRFLFCVVFLNYLFIMEKEYWWHNHSESFLQEFLDPERCLTPVGTGFTSKCHSTQKASICVCTVEADVVDHTKFKVFLFALCHD